MTITLTTYVVTYAPWPIEDDEPQELSCYYAEEDVEPEDGMTIAELVAERLSAATEASVGGAITPTTVNRHVWYSAETYMHPYSGEREERTYHLDGADWTDELAREVYALVGV